MNHKKKHRLKSRVRFFAFIVVMIVLSVSTLNTVLGFNDAEGQTQDQYLTIEVISGDTLWDIASEYMSDQMDIRQAVHVIMTLNQISAEELMPGQEIKIPV